MSLCTMFCASLNFIQCISMLHLITCISFYAFHFLHPYLLVSFYSSLSMHFILFNTVTQLETYRPANGHCHIFISVRQQANDVAFIRCQGTKCPLLTAFFFLFLSSPAVTFLQDGVIVGFPKRKVLRLAQLVLAGLNS